MLHFSTFCEPMRLRVSKKKRCFNSCLAFDQLDENLIVKCSWNILRLFVSPWGDNRKRSCWSRATDFFNVNHYEVPVSLCNLTYLLVFCCCFASCLQLTSGQLKKHTHTHTQNTEIRRSFLYPKQWRSWRSGYPWHCRMHSHRPGNGPQIGMKGILQGRYFFNSKKNRMQFFENWWFFRFIHRMCGVFVSSLMLVWLWMQEKLCWWWLKSILNHIYVASNFIILIVMMCYPPWNSLPPENGWNTIVIVYFQGQNLLLDLGECTICI